MGKNTFILKNIDIHELLAKNGYGDINILRIAEGSPPEIGEACASHIGDEDTASFEAVTNLSDLLHEKSLRYITIYDSSKINSKMWLIMADFTSSIFLPITTDKPCWWCRGTFKSSPIGCPIEYCPSTMSNSPLGRDSKKLEYVKQKFINSNVVKERSDGSVENPSCKTGYDFFETEGIFCSFPCCKAYIIDKNGSNRKYKESCTLLTLMYYKLYGEIINIETAASFHIIKEWGGHLTLEEFRNSHCKLIYNITTNVKRPFMCATGIYIEERKHVM